MDKMNTLYVSDRKEWRKWLEKNFNKQREIWLVYPKKHTNKSRILYNDAVEEALCFGWIDSNIKKVDDDQIAQRFSPRNAKSEFSQANKERLIWLAGQKMLHPSIFDTVKHILNEEFIYPADILTEIKKDHIAWDNYKKFSDSYKRIRIAYIDTARKRPDEFRKRLANFIKKTKENKLVGFGGIEKYY